MAIAPSNEDAFLREVDEDYRRDRLVGFFRRYGRLVAGAVGVFLLVLAGGLWWQNHRAAQAGADSERLTTALAGTADAGGSAADQASLKALEESPRAGYRAAAMLAQAGLIERKGDAAGAAKAFDAIAADAGLPQPIRDLATIRSVSAGFERLAPQAVADRLKGLLAPGIPWYPGAAELTALAWLKANQPNRAAPLLAGIARDETAPASMRSRAAAMAGALGQTIAPAATPVP